MIKEKKEIEDSNILETKSFKKKSDQQCQSLQRLRKRKINKKSLYLAITILFSNLRGQLHLSDEIYFLKHGQNLTERNHTSGVKCPQNFFMRIEF